MWLAKNEKKHYRTASLAGNKNCWLFQKQKSALFGTLPFLEAGIDPAADSSNCAFSMWWNTYNAHTPSRLPLSPATAYTYGFQLCSGGIFRHRQPYRTPMVPTSEHRCISTWTQFAAESEVTKACNCRTRTITVQSHLRKSSWKKQNETGGKKN